MKSKKKAIEPVLSRNGLTFEQAIQRLEKIVVDKEGADSPLEDVLKKYEEGTRLVRFCNQKLEEAEKKIEVLAKKTDGTIVLEPFETDKDEGESEQSEDEGGKLF
jgi:exodeoxyribonuclease VII small subunit